MPIRWLDLLDAFHAADCGDDACAWINAQTGAIRIRIPDTDGDEPPPDDDPTWHAVPNGRDLDLKQALVWRFVRHVCPAEEDAVRRCFSRRGAWRAFKDLLARRGLLDRWHDFQDHETRQALLAWTVAEGLAVIEPPPPGKCLEDLRCDSADTVSRICRPR
jgi:hypothetical protein